jgi:hypothetical protein
MGFILYGINFAFFHTLAIHMSNPEGSVLLSHILFSLFASASYKGMAPRPFLGGGVISKTRQLSISDDDVNDPELAPAVREEVER